jgi:hypothetical protein
MKGSNFCQISTGLIFLTVLGLITFRPATAELLHIRTDLGILSSTFRSASAISDSNQAINLIRIKDKMNDFDTRNLNNSGIEGQVTIGPVSPVERLGIVNERPYQGTITVLNRAGQLVTQFQSDADGHFRVFLEPGTYILRPESPGSLPRADEQTVTVTDKNFTQVRITYDSGIR